MAQERVKEAAATGAGQLVSCCPFCYQGLQIGISAQGADLEARDLSSLMEASMRGKES